MLWQKYFYPEMKLSVDKFMIPFKDRTSILMYMPAKPTKLDWKLWGLADAKTGYLYNLLQLVGCETVQVPRTVGTTHNVVSSLSENVQNREYVIYTDNSFFSPALIHQVVQHKKGTWSILPVNWKGVQNKMKASRVQVSNASHTEMDTFYRFPSITKDQ